MITEQAVEVASPFWLVMGRGIFYSLVKRLPENPHLPFDRLLVRSCGNPPYVISPPPGRRDKLRKKSDAKHGPESNEGSKQNEKDPSP
jgi:hypothetical protein